ncbi:MAG TPA: glycosyltransferase, partial [Gemmatimonadaceae bacterium]
MIELPNRPDVVHVTRSTNAGVRRHLVDLMLGLHDLGVRQSLVYAPDDADQGFWDGLARMQALGISAYSISMPRRLSARHDFAAARELRRLLRILRPRVLHLHSSKAGGIGRLASLGIAGLPVVYSPHASAAHLGRVYADIERVLGRLHTDRLVAVSTSERSELARLAFVAPQRLVAVECGIEPEEVRRAAAAPSPLALPDRPLVAAVGRLSEQKNPLLLVRAAESIARQIPDAHFVWIGDGDLRPEVDRAIAKAGLQERWTITGWLANPYPILSRANVFVLPSRYESFGYVTLEAMVLGRPVIASNVAGSRDLVVNGETGLLVREGDVDALADAVTEVLRDPSKAARLGTAGSARSSLFSREHMSRRMLDVYRQVGGPSMGIPSVPPYEVM